MKKFLKNLFNKNSSQPIFIIYINFKVYKLLLNEKEVFNGGYCEELW